MFRRLQADAFTGYAERYRGHRIRQVACVAHARRKLHYLQLRPPTVARQALERVCYLHYVIERIPDTTLRAASKNCFYGTWLSGCRPPPRLAS
jgi:hypothetical protein